MTGRTPTVSVFSFKACNLTDPDVDLAILPADGRLFCHPPGACLPLDSTVVLVLYLWIGDLRSAALDVDLAGMPPSLWITSRRSLDGAGC
jgi:hypothetical protein